MNNHNNEHNKHDILTTKTRSKIATALNIESSKSHLVNPSSIYTTLDKVVGCESS